MGPMSRYRQYSVLTARQQDVSLNLSQFVACQYCLRNCVCPGSCRAELLKIRGPHRGPRVHLYTNSNQLHTLLAFPMPHFSEYSCSFPAHISGKCFILKELEHHIPWCRDTPSGRFRPRCCGYGSYPMARRSLAGGGQESLLAWP